MEIPQKLSIVKICLQHLLAPQTHKFKIFCAASHYYFGLRYKNMKFFQSLKDHFLLRNTLFPASARLEAVGAPAPAVKGDRKIKFFDLKHPKCQNFRTKSKPKCQIFRASAPIRTAAKYFNSNLLIFYQRY